MALNYAKEQEKFLRKELGNELYEYLEEITMPSEDKQLLLHRISKLIIRLTHKYHKKDRDIVAELYENSLNINQLIGQEMEKIRLRERGKIG